MSDWGATQRVSAEVVLADGADPFFPLTLQQGGVAFVSKAQVAVVSCRDQSPLDPDRASAARLVALEVSLANGSEYRGRATYELPPARSRTLDYVNGTERFFTVRTDDRTRYINKALVRRTNQPEDRYGHSQ